MFQPIARLHEEPRSTHKVAEKLAEVASILRSQGADPFRINAYLRAADLSQGLSRLLDEIVEKKGP
jgi:DNA polymerase/3'-5' exonuclease PolX